MSKILIEVDTDSAASVEAARDLLGVLSGGTTGTTSKPEKAPAKDTKPTAEKAPAKVEEKKPVDKKPAGPTEAEKEALYAPVKAKALELNKAKGRDALLRVLSVFDAEKAPDLKIEQYDAFIAAADEELIS